ncbi:hypothetical protein MASR1M65_03930 [Saprospiraceae bacterium]
MATARAHAYENIEDVHLRVAKVGGEIFIDLADSDLIGSWCCLPTVYVPPVIASIFATWFTRTASAWGRP